MSIGSFMSSLASNRWSLLVYETKAPLQSPVFLKRITEWDKVQLRCMNEAGENQHCSDLGQKQVWQGDGQGRLA